MLHYSGVKAYCKALNLRDQRECKVKLKQGMLAALALVGVVTVTGFSANTTWAKANTAIAKKAASTTNLPNEKLIQYLEANSQGQTYLLAVADTSQAAPIILESGQAVLAIGGFMGTDASLTATQAAEMVSQGQMRYFLVSGGSGGGRGGLGSGASTSAVNSWVQQQCTVVDSTLWSISPRQPLRPPRPAQLPVLLPGGPADSSSRQPSRNSCTTAGL